LLIRGRDAGLGELEENREVAIRNRLMGPLVTHVERVAPVVDASVSR
jgi:hypothetical protein